MATSSGSRRSLGTQESRWRRNGDSYSPIPYREGPLEYTPAVLCKCGAKAARFISWSDLNPGLRYLKCARARDGGCDFYNWVDPPNSSFKKQLLLNLRDAVKYWKHATGIAEQSLEEARMETARLLEGATRENQRLRDVAIMQAELQLGAESRVELEVRIGTLEKERKFLFGTLFVCVGLVAASWMPWIILMHELNAQDHV
ncbi:uncharacterized protein [Miscanthus floridulus]|uniref:uncharacterized protein n=1 Tax=Miscanthus floridulus TaxID=154761 RepID=UPI00345A2B77